METITKVKVQKNHLIARKKDVVMRWFIVLEGSVIQRNSYAKVVLEKNAVIGISESGRYLCDYIAAADSVLAVFPYSAPGDLKAVINGNAGMRGILLRAAANQRQLLLKSYAVFQGMVRQFHSFAENEYSAYTTLCAQYGLQPQRFAGMEQLKPLEMVHRAENWEISNSISLMHHLEEYLQLMQKDDDMCIGAIMESCYQSRRVMQGTIEMVNYLVYNQRILLSESEHDIFHQYLKLFVSVKKKQGDIAAIAEHVGRIVQLIRKMNIYDEKLVASAVGVYRRVCADAEEARREAMQSAEASGGRAAESAADAEASGRSADGFAAGTEAAGGSEQDAQNYADASAEGRGVGAAADRGDMAAGTAAGEMPGDGSQTGAADRAEAGSGVDAVADTGAASGMETKSELSAAGSAEKRAGAAAGTETVMAEAGSGEAGSAGAEAGSESSVVGDMDAESEAEAAGSAGQKAGAAAGKATRMTEAGSVGTGSGRSGNAEAGLESSVVGDMDAESEAESVGSMDPGAEGMSDGEPVTAADAAGLSDEPAGAEHPEITIEDVHQENCLEKILNYAGFSEQEKEEAEDAVIRYQSLPDVFSADKEVYALRRDLIKIFYDVYHRVFMRTMEEEGTPEPVIRMFLNFGFMDAQLAGEENTTLLYGLVERLDACRSEHVYTVYEWLKSIYNGENQPSKNEFDLDYPAYLADLRKNGKITADQEKRHLHNQEYMVRYELQNMFASGNRVTYGKMSAFCPLLGEYDLINSPDKMLVTAQRLEEAIDKIRQIDFSVFYREIQFSDPEKGINREMIMKEVMPDIILMPNAGTRAMMWQETVGVKKDTPARFLFPIMTVADIDDLMMETMGRYRWEICRRIQGVHWNDIREKSLTSEYCDYLQFYRKNNEISPEVKEKIRNALLRGRNNFREVFVKDYQSWIKYESHGSYRVNKVARSILIRYCPFARPIRAELKANPMYQSDLERYEILKAKTVQRIHNVYDKYQKAGGEITKELEDNLDFYDL